MLFQLAIPRIANAHILSNIFIRNPVYDPFVVFIQIFQEILGMACLPHGEHGVQFLDNHQHDPLVT